VEIKGFMHKFPEVSGNPPGTRIEEADFRWLRRQQILDLARAYDVEVPDVPKPLLLNLLETARTMGRLSGKPKRPYYYMRSYHNADNPVPPDSEEWHDVDELYGAPSPKRQDVASQDSDFRGLQRACREAGIKSWGMSVPEMREALARINDLKERSGDGQEDIGE
jgi:hypothetical protein